MKLESLNKSKFEKFGNNVVKETIMSAVKGGTVVGQLTCCEHADGNCDQVYAVWIEDGHEYSLSKPIPGWFC